eukprot:gene854-24428_t
MGTEDMMSPKAHGTTATPPQDNLKWGCDPKTADNICCFNRHYAEHSGEASGEITFYDTVTGKPLFIAPRGRTWAHGWPSFRDEEVIPADVRVLPNGETISVDGTHLGHNLPDGTGNRYCINLVCVAGSPK